KVEYLAEGVPAYKLTNTSSLKRYNIVKEIFADPFRDCVLQKVTFNILQKVNNDLNLYFIISPHLGNHGAGNTGWIGDYKGTPMLFAERDGIAMAVACSIPWKYCSAGFAGSSDGWQDLRQNKKLTLKYDKAENGNIALTGEIDLLQNQTNEFVIAIGFGQNWSEAGQRAKASILDDFNEAKKIYMSEWEEWFKGLDLVNSINKNKNLELISASVLRIHEAKRFPGGLIASLSIPWGFHKGDDDLGGYHLVWPRDLAEAAGGLLAVKAFDDAKRVINFLISTQENDGHWSQNMWLDGSTYWQGIQMDETAFPILLIDLAYRKGALDEKDVIKYWPSVRKAASYLVCNGPVTQQDRWEEDAGYSPFTLAVEIPALLAAADFAEMNNEKETASFLRDTADNWNSSIERWTYAAGSELAKNSGVEGYYVRIAAQEVADASSPTQGFVPIKNRPPGSDREEAVHIISPDALALVRFGLRDANDPKIKNTVKVIDELLKVETPYGTAWHRYNDDGYGEHEDGRPFDGTGIGRAWPLLAGERAHYELAAGNVQNASKLLEALENFSNDGGMISEQVWDTNDIPDRELFFGRPSGSAMPLVWAHAEYVKLTQSLKDKKIFDMPPQTYKRYVIDKVDSKYAVWSFNNKCRYINKGKIFRIETLAKAKIRWSSDEWKTYTETQTNDTGLGIHIADIPANKLKIGSKIQFTFYWPESKNWENENFVIEIK
ncbi:MAG TPA: glycoside hydrolase family 15 protein, partial [Ignavibacteriaceae bacterium]|nr:glycoside hydrolase family 15 protein [Ignavibacteriaceae bacterium]